MVVDDSVVIRGLLSRWIDAADGMEVVAAHRNGQLAVNDIEKSAPDVVVLDIEMPEMDGLTALPQILKRKPDTIVVMASTLTQRNAEISLKALQLGAKDYVPKPTGNHGITTSVEFRRDLIDKITALAGAQRKPALGSAAAAAGPGAPVSATSPVQIKLRPYNRLTPSILTVGSSTGGPQALMEFFKTVGPAIDLVPVVITQHMPATFTAILATHIAKLTGRVSKEGEQGEALKAGTVYVAPGGKHMIIEGAKREARIALTDGPPINFCKPAVDPLFDSVAAIYGNSALAVVLTGMGSDGAKGAVNLADAGGNVIAQDEKTSVVWGMPRAAALAGACAAVLPLEQIGPKVSAILGGRFA
jgi:two-component system chemotaxis response regulator CheB